MNRVSLAFLLFAGSAAAQIPGFSSTPINFPGIASSQAVDPFGNLWIADPINAVIGRIELPSEKFTAYPVPATEQNAKPYNIATTADGAVWYTDYDNPVIGRRSLDGNFTLFPIAGPAFYIAASPDNGVFFSFFGGSVAALGYVNASGGVTNIQLPTPANAFVEDLTVGPDGMAYFTDLRSNHRIVRMGLDGSVKTFPNSVPNPPVTFTWYPSITAGPDGNMWFSHATAIGRLRLSDGVITEFPIPYPKADASGICTGGDGNLWFADSFAGAGVVSRLVVSTATDDGHATINASPGIGEPIGIIAIPPLATQTLAKSKSPNSEAACPGLIFSAEQNVFSGANLDYITLPGSNNACADLRFLPQQILNLIQVHPQINFTFQIFNAGPDTANSPELQVNNVEGVSNIDVLSLSGWNCNNATATLVICNRTSPMAAGDLDEGTVSITPKQLGMLSVPYLEVDAFVFSTTPDPLLFNNLFSLGFATITRRTVIQLRGIKTNNLHSVSGRP